MNGLLAAVKSEALTPSVRRGFQLALLALAGMAVVSARSALAPLWEPMRLALSLSDDQFALLQRSAFTLPMLIIAVPLGLGIDRYTRARLIPILIFLLIVGGFLTATASSFGALFLARSIVGFAVLAFFPVAASLVADL